MKDCIFCKIVKNELPADKVFENDDIVAFKDIKPLAPVHILIIPKKHFSGADKLGENYEIAGKLILAAVEIANRFHLESGYRIVTNVGEHGCQSVGHLHFHLLGGKQLNTELG